MGGNTKFQCIWLPGFLFMGVLIGGGYATGRELVEFFLSVGTVAGLLSMLLATALFSVIVALTFELARMTKSYDYRSFFHQLLGRWWFLFEVAYLLLCILVLAVIGAASGEMVHKHMGVPSAVGTVGLMLVIGMLVFFGNNMVEKALGSWSLVLYGTYGLFVILYLSKFSGDFFSNLQQESIGTEWIVGGIKYVGYSIAVIPAILFCVQHMESRRDALVAGVLAGPIAMLPAVLFFLTMIASYPEVLDAPVPADYMIQRLGQPLMKVIFYIAVFGTFVQTGTGLVHAINERIAGVYHEKNGDMPRWLRPVVALVVLVFSVVLADQFGLKSLISNGYGTLTWVFILVFFVPLVTIGVWKLTRGTPAGSEPVA